MRRRGCLSPSADRCRIPHETANGFNTGIKNVKGKADYSNARSVGT